MPSELRTKLNKELEGYAKQLQLRNAKILDVGIAGDKIKPSDRYPIFGRENVFKTLDILPQFNPDYVADICHTDFSDDYWDLVICCQTIEHIWDYKDAITEIFRVTKKYAIIDCPFMYPQHNEPGFDDYWRFSASAIKRLAEEAGFQKVQAKNIDNLLTIALCQK